MTKTSILKCGVAAVALVAGTIVASASASADIEIGALYPFSGGLALLGDESYRGLELAVEEWNAAGGIQGEPINLIRGDAVDNNQAVGEARRLISVEGVQAIFGTYSSSRSNAASQVAELAGVPYFELGAISDPITERGFQYLFRTNPTARSFAVATVDAIPNAIAPALGVDVAEVNVAIIYEDSLYGTTVSGFQAERAEELDLNVVEVLPYPADTVDMSSLILRLQGAEVDVVLQTSYQNDTVLFFRQSNEMDFAPIAIGAGGGYSLQQTVEAVGADVIHGALNVDFTQYATNPAAAPGIEEFVAAYEARYDQPPRSGHSLANYMGAMVILEALDNAEGMEADAIRAAMQTVDVAAGTTPTGWGVAFDENGQNTRAVPFLMQWQDGNLVTVFPSEAAVSDMVIGGQ